jgi:drug/metabolite transporter (DMT)-like permease
VEATATQLRHSYSPYQVVFTRYVVHLLAMVALWGWREPASLVRTRRPVYQLARSLLMVCMPVSWIVAAQRGLEPGSILVVFWIAPLLLLAFARVVLGERPSSPTWLLTAVASAGAALAFAPPQAPSARLLVFPAAMAISFSLYVAMTRSLRTETTRANLFYTALGVALTLAPAMPHVWIRPTARDLAVMIAIGLVGLVCLWALDRLAATAPVARAAPLVSLQVAFALALEWAGGRVLPTARTAISLSLIAAVTLCAWVREPAAVAERTI